MGIIGPDGMFLVPVDRAPAFSKFLLDLKGMTRVLAGVPHWIEHQLRTNGSPVRFPVRALAWVASQVPSRGHVRDNHT